MFGVLLVVALIICILLALVILIQNPKGGGLSGTFGGTANQLFGYKRTSDDIEKITWGLGIFILLICLGSAAFKPANTSTENPFQPEADRPAIQQPVAPDQPDDNSTLDLEDDGGDFELPEQE